MKAGRVSESPSAIAGPDAVPGAPAGTPKDNQYSRRPAGAPRNHTDPDSHRTGTPIRALVAGVGNIFLGDDGFGVEVARRLSEKELPDWVTVTDYGIRGMHLAHDLANTRYDLTIMVDAVAMQDPPGTVAVIELDTSGPPDAGLLDGHGMQPDVVLGLVRLLGGRPGKVVLVGCQPAVLDECMGLSPAVAEAIGPAVTAIMALISEQRRELTCAWVSPEK